MSDDILARAEEALAAEWVNPKSPTALCYIASELVAELKAARAEAERLRLDAEMWRSVQSMYQGMGRQ